MKEIVLCTLQTRDWCRYQPDALACASPIWSKHWLERQFQRLGWWLCTALSLNCYWPVREVAHFSVSLDSSRIIDNIRLCRADMLRIWHREAKFLVLSHKTAARIWDQETSNQFFCFDLEFPLNMGSTARICGLTAVVVPWLDDGVLVLPELPQPNLTGYLGRDMVGEVSDTMSEKQGTEAAHDNHARAT